MIVGRPMMQPCECPLHGLPMNQPTMVPGRPEGAENCLYVDIVWNGESSATTLKNSILQGGEI